MQIDVNTQVQVQPALNIPTILQYADMVSKVEGRDLYKHIAKMNVAAGDLAANATEGIEDREGIYDEVAGLILRATIFGLAYGMTTGDLMQALGRETQNLVQRGVDTAVAESMAKMGFVAPTAVPGFGPLTDLASALGIVGAVPGAAEGVEGCTTCAAH